MSSREVWILVALVSAKPCSYLAEDRDGEQVTRTVIGYVPYVIEHEQLCEDQFPTIDAKVDPSAMFKALAASEAGTISHEQSEEPIIAKDETILFPSDSANSATPEQSGEMSDDTEELSDESGRDGLELALQIVPLEAETKI